MISSVITNVHLTKDESNDSKELSCFVCLENWDSNHKEV